ncbi:MAG: hypothetical protein HY869_06015 [Chloroflexi bacterium]|nr:hypothetical protein [Chloroflexota bacterium]
MNINNKQNTNPYILSKNGRILLIILVVVIFCVLPFFGLFHLFLALLAIIAISLSLGLFIYNKQMLTYSLLSLLIGLLLITSSATIMYASFQADLTQKSIYQQLGGGLSMISSGLTFLAGSIAIPKINKSGYLKNSEFKYPRYSIVICLISGIVQIASGTFIFILGLQQL